MGSDLTKKTGNATLSLDSMTSVVADEISVALLTGGGDRPYVFGLVNELLSKGATLDLIGSDDLDFPEFHQQPRLNFLNLRGDQRASASLPKKVCRVLLFYLRLIRYAATAKPGIFHILWNNKIVFFDRTLLMLYYKLLGKRIVLTVHNVNAGKRDGEDAALNRLTLRVQYRLADHIFGHTEKMKHELVEEYGVKGSRVTVIPFGINNAVPNTSLTLSEARRRLKISDNEWTILFFGNIAPYKGLEFLVEAFRQILERCGDFRLIIAGKPKNCEKYWSAIRESLHEYVQAERIVLRDDFIPDEETEIYFKAADVLVLPYTHVYQSGVLFLGYSFGLPVLAADVGSLRDDIVEGKTGFIFNPADPVDLARAIEQYFASDLFMDLHNRRQQIRSYAIERYSWAQVGKLTTQIYSSLDRSGVRNFANHNASSVSL